VEHRIPVAQWRFGRYRSQTPIESDANLIHLMPKDFAFDLEVWIAMPLQAGRCDYPFET
jgi:hypothetical protein